MVKARQNEQREQRIVKAMACGTPVVGFKVGGIPEMLEEGRTGLLAPALNVTELARAIDFLLDHYEKRMERAARARKRAEELFPRDGQVQKYLDLYLRLVANRDTSKTLGLQIAPNFPSASRASVSDLISENTDCQSRRPQSVFN
jgi:glycosyltransferase involved in cell wall biosynthesis